MTRRPNRSGADFGGSHPRPTPLCWQAGVTPGNDEYRITLDGEPVPMAFAAVAGPAGWVKSYAEDYDGDSIRGDAFMVPTDALGEPKTVTRHGDVRIVRCPLAMQ